jgi:hypothetical protein
MRAPTIGRWVGRAAVVAAVGLGVSLTGGVAASAVPAKAKAPTSVDAPSTQAPAPTGYQTFGFEWG